MPVYQIKPGGMHEKALKSRVKIQVIAGGFGNGKTACMSVKLMELVKGYPGGNFFVGMATYAQLNDTFREEVYKWTPKSWVKRWPTIADNTMLMKNGSKVNFRYLKQKGKSTADGQTVSNLLSATYDAALVDQIENPEITYKDFLDLLGRLRGTTPYKGNDPTMPATGPRWLVVAANPSFNWVYHKLIKPWYYYKKTGKIHKDLIVHPETNEPMIEVFEGSTYENKHNLEPDFIRGLEAAYTGQFRDRYLGGEWGAFEGLIFPEFKQDYHMISRADIMSYVFKSSLQGIRFTAIEGFDYGTAVPSCYLFGFVDMLGRIFILDGFYQKEMSIEQIASEIHKIRGKYAPHIDIENSILADPAIFKRTVINKQGGGATTIKDMLLDNHDIYCRPGQNDITSGLAKHRSYLGYTEFPSFQNEAVNGPVFMIASELEFIADEYGSYFWKTGTNIERIDKPTDKDDHAMDTIKYMLSDMPDASEFVFKRDITSQSLRKAV